MLNTAGVEIVSPRFMNQRLLESEQAIIPNLEAPSDSLPEEEVAPSGDVIFADEVKPS